MFSYTWQRDLLLEFACQIWSPKCRYLIDKIESVQDFLLENYTAFVISYLDRVHVLGLETLEHRRLIGHDLVLCYKYLHGLIDTDNRNFWCVQLSARTMKQCHTHSFMHRWLLFTNLVCLCIPCLRPLIGVSLFSSLMSVRPVLGVSIFNNVSSQIWFPFLQRAQCSHCKRCISYSNSVCPSVCPSVRPSIRHTPVLCQNDGT